MTYCVRQLADYQAHIKEFKEENIDVIALSVDPLDKAKVGARSGHFSHCVRLEGTGGRKQDWRLLGRTAQNHSRDQLHCDADRKVTQACYATGPIGRIVAEDALRSIQGTKKRKTQAG